MRLTHYRSIVMETKVRPLFQPVGRTKSTTMSISIPSFLVLFLTLGSISCYQTVLRTESRYSTEGLLFGVDSLWLESSRTLGVVGSIRNCGVGASQLPIIQGKIPIGLVTVEVLRADGYWQEVSLPNDAISPLSDLQPGSSAQVEGMIPVSHVKFGDVVRLRLFGLQSRPIELLDRAR